MNQNPAGTPEDEKKRPFKDLLVWLALIPLILLTLLCCGQLAVFLTPFGQGDNTASLLSADYSPWPYDRIPPVNVEAFLTDVIREQAQHGTPLPDETIIVGDFWELPTTTAIVVSMGTQTPEPRMTGSPTTTAILPITQTPTATGVATQTRTPLPTSTQRPTSTLLPTITFTRIPPTWTATLPPPPPPTNTPEPPPQPTRTPTITLPPAPTLTYTVTPTATTPLTPTFTNTPIFPTPTYAPLRPVVENGGMADQINGGCRAYFGYWNDNPNEIDIPVGPLNFLDDPAAATNPPQPTHFLVGRVFGAFEFTWYTGLPLTWTLDNRAATADWCY